METEPFDWLILSHELVIATVAAALHTFQILRQSSANVSKFCTAMPQKNSCIYFALATIALLANAPVQGRCPDHCSGHGSCVIQNHKHLTRVGGRFMCECWPGFVGLNCAGRECPYGRALSDVPTGDDVAHGYLECSGRGECNREDGTCVCYSGTEGQACSKLSCPNRCSGHGKCESIKNLARYYGSISYTYNGWDSGSAVGCRCCLNENDW